MPKDDEIHFEPTSAIYGSYGMSGFPTHDLAFHVESEFEPNTMPGGTLIPYHVERFGRQVTLHLPFRRWKLHHIFLLGLGLVILLGYQIRDE